MMSNKYRFLLFVVLCSTSLFGQSPYKLSFKTDGILLGSGLAVATTSFFIGKNHKPFEESEIALLNREDIWSIDRPAAYNWSIPSKKASDHLLRTSFAFPATLLFDSKANSHFGQVSLMYLETLLITEGLTNLLKNTARRTRPFVYNPDPSIPYNLKLTKNARRSYFSGHTSTAACMSFLTAKLYNDFHPNSSARPYIWGTAALIPAAMGGLRVKAGKHFFTDVLTGYVVGALVGIIVPQLHK